MKNSELLTTTHQNMTRIEKQRRYILRSLVQKNECPNCGNWLNFFEGAGVEIDDWSSHGDPASCRCNECKRGLIYTVPFFALSGNGGWLWRLAPIEPGK